MTMANTKTAIIYARVSSVKQAEEGLPIDSQLDQCESRPNYSAPRCSGCFVTTEFQEERRAGRRFRRDQLAAYHVDYFIVWNTSRFARNKVDAASYKRILQREKQRLSMRQPRLTATPTKVGSQESIFEIVDEHYSRVIARVPSAKHDEKRQGRVFNGGRVPFGYSSVPNGSAANWRSMNLNPCW